MNTNIEFEKFTQHVYQKLVNNRILKPTKVQHNVKLKGKSGCEHQIDVYWEYEIAGVTHRVAIECKDYSSTIQIGRVRDFFGVLYDLGDIKGIMVTSKGYQEGAKRFAMHYGIVLQKLRKPGYDENVGEVDFEFHFNSRRCLFLIDEVWAEQNNLNFQKYREKLAFIANKSPEEYWKGPHISFETKNDIIRNSKNEKISTLEELEKQLPAIQKTNDSFVFSFDDAWIESLRWGPLKILEVKYEDTYEEQKTTVQLEADRFVEAILEDAISGETKYIPKH